MKILIRFAITIALLMALILWWGWVPSSAFKDVACQRYQNAAWISVDWTSAPVDEGAVASLARRAEANELTYLFPYVSYVKRDGSFSPSYTYAGEFVAQFRLENPETKLLAWLGVPVVNDRYVGIDGWVNLSDSAQRRKIVAFAETLLGDAGFDGIHLNVETVQDGDVGYLLLLEEMEAAIGEEYLISIASTYWLPTAINNLPLLDGYRWSGEYYGAIAQRVDQIVTMTYDSAMPHPALYRWWMREQVRGIHKHLFDNRADSLPHKDVELLIGLSVSQENTLTHRPHAETIQSGLSGLCAGVAGLSDVDAIDGVALYAAWEADDHDWQIWQEWMSGGAVVE